MNNQGGEAERAALVASVYERIVATDQGIIEVELAEDAMRHGLAIALPELVKVVLARPARAGRSETTLVRVPIRGRAEWLAVSRERTAS